MSLFQVHSKQMKQWRVFEGWTSTSPHHPMEQIHFLLNQQTPTSRFTQKYKDYSLILMSSYITLQLLVPSSRGFRESSRSDVDSLHRPRQLPEQKSEQRNRVRFHTQVYFLLNFQKTTQKTWQHSNLIALVLQ